MSLPVKDTTNAPREVDAFEDRRALYDTAYENLGRDVGLEIAERSHDGCARVPGDGWFYGELSWEGMWDVVALAEPKPGDIFLDLGSGLGKMVVAQSLTRDFAECWGVEILPELHDAAMDAPGKLRAAMGDDAFDALPEVDLRRGDMLAADVSDADVIYCYATVFAAQVVSRLQAKLAAEMKPGARLVMISKQMESPEFDAFGVGYFSVPQAHSRWNMDAWLYVKR
ncbi:uncharacterized protein MICPUCDRAFT_51323 [Micromonas pusilla CCMP1545]|uniref:Histone-lysine N-methyltransferase, H3 lysine-79 specific n=1 Tax=Micromonas pusilla (strain CCMP1545) TaxID=564608 RepID=C1N1A3_MICPC|nr:uncharacterized protein MICPUCDRAFT_51323 [Micromonas pusilla CCMP1545]EEH54407.1 predicted protein [Micromonas pusilla CCMP1545]|eukprot:XP_003061777.1 predicted protein [Micromonas pusilla CCMP1545]